MITECNSPVVPLSRELSILRDYISLEKIRYGSRLKMEAEIDGDPEDKFVVPLLLIPFVENSFKHGTSKMLESSWIKMKIDIRDAELRFTLTNSKPPVANAGPGKSGIGLRNVRKRLELIYPGQHELKIVSGDTEFSVFMCVPLQMDDALNFEERQHDATLNLSHATH
jgi:LytS/YehU family sensor histidine kinase